jgi:hypothetical protein
MGFYYRKSVNLGPFRVNLSKSGLGYSVGGRGFRVGTTARGKKYTSFSIPGTGVGYRKSGVLCNPSFKIQNPKSPSSLPVYQPPATIAIGRWLVLA